MPKVRRPGKRTLYVELDEATYAQLEALAQVERRTLKAVVLEGLELKFAASAEPAGRSRGQKKGGKG